MKKQTIAVIFGGQSGEHEVSLVSGHAVMHGLDPARYHVLPIGITKDGHWLIGGDALEKLIAQADQRRLPSGVEWKNPPGVQTINGHFAVPDSQQGWHPGSLFRSVNVAVVFPMLHGPMGEDGTVQGLLELAGMPYVGCGVAASAIGLDKVLMKAAFAAAGLPQLPWLPVLRRELQRDAQQVYTQIESQLTYPLFVKPANMGSSVGVGKASSRSDLAEALDTAARYDRRIVVEQGINAREIEVSVLGNDEPTASTPGEIVPAGEWYTYEAKYISGKSELRIPAPIDDELAARVQVLGSRAFLAIDGAGLARVDFLLDKDSGELWLNEVNTMPGFTDASMYAKLWEASGLPYGKLLDRLIDLALERQRH